MNNFPIQISNIILGKTRESNEYKTIGRWSLPITTEADLSFAIKAAQSKQNSNFDDVVNGLVRIGKSGDWINEYHLTVIAEETGAPISYLKKSIVVFNYWLSNLHDYLANLGVESGGCWFKRHKIHQMSGYTTSIILAGDDATLAPWVIAHILLAGTCSVIKASTAEPLSAFLFVKAISEQGLQTPPLLYLQSSSNIDREYIFRLIKWSNQSVVFGEDKTIQTVHLNSQPNPQHKMIAYWTGRSGAIVLDDANLHLAAHSIVYGTIMDRGNKCISTKKVFVTRNILEKFEYELLQASNAVVSGSPCSPDTNVGAFDQSVVDTIKRETNSAEVLFDGVLRIVKVDCFHPLLNEELPYPILALCIVDSETDAINLSNRSVVQTPLGASLAISVFTESEPAFQRCADKLIATKVIHNAPSSFFDFCSTHQGIHLFLELVRPQERIIQIDPSYFDYA